VVGALALKDGTLYVGSTDGLLRSGGASCTNVCPSSDQVPSFDTGSSIWARHLPGDLIPCRPWTAAFTPNAATLGRPTDSPSGKRRLLMRPRLPAKTLYS
jgi:hypothetical protein